MGTTEKVMKDLKKELEEDVYRRNWVNSWLHNYGLTDSDELNAGEVEELCEQMVTDRDTQVRQEERKKTLEEAIPRLSELAEDRSKIPDSEWNRLMIEFENKLLKDGNEKETIRG